MDLINTKFPTPLQVLRDSVTEQAGVLLYLKRDDLIHPEVSGNKWRKLKYTLLDAVRNRMDTLLTFGGARSNHLYATAAAGRAMGIKTIGIVRGEEYPAKETDTLSFCKSQGMQLVGVTRTEYRRRNEAQYIQDLKKHYGNPMVIPEGGTTLRALPGVAELVEETANQLEKTVDYYAVAAGTGGTAAGILSAGAKVLAFSALKGGEFLRNDILDLTGKEEIGLNLQLFTHYHFGGYAKHKPELLQFMEEFEQIHNVLLEHVYTGKMLFGLYDLIKQGYFPAGTTLVAVHTGGLQGRSHDQ